MINRVFLIVLDSFGIGALPDAGEYGDAGSDTLAAIARSSRFSVPNLRRLGLFHIDGVSAGEPAPKAEGSFARLAERSKGKDTTIGHWEIAGLVSPELLPTYPEGFPKGIIEKFEKATGRKVLCNRPYSGTKVIEDYGVRHMETGALIVYTSADSVFQIAAHEEIVKPELLYEYCRAAREILTGRHAVGRVIARPFAGEYPLFKRTANRHDFSLAPPRPTMLDLLAEKEFDTLAVGKINDIFAGRGISCSEKIENNADGMRKTIKMLNKDFRGLCFVNLVDFDMLYGHRNDADGYAAAVSDFDRQLGEFLGIMKDEDVLMITSDHGCDPSTPSTDHSREYTPMLITGKRIKPGINLGTRKSFSDIAATVLDIFGTENTLEGESFLPQVRQS